MGEQVNLNEGNGERRPRQVCARLIVSGEESESSQTGQWRVHHQPLDRRSSDASSRHWGLSSLPFTRLESSRRLPNFGRSRASLNSLGCRCIYIACLVIHSTTNELLFISYRTVRSTNLKFSFQDFERWIRAVSVEKAFGCTFIHLHITENSVRKRRFTAILMESETGIFLLASWI